MSIYVDDLRLAASVGRLSARWSHLYADDEAELHEFAARIGMRRAWFQDHPSLPHYDLTETRRAAAIDAGAIAVGFRHTAVFIRERRAAAGSGTETPSSGPLEGGPDQNV